MSAQFHFNLSSFKQCSGRLDTQLDKANHFRVAAQNKNKQKVYLHHQTITGSGSMALTTTLAFNQDVVNSDFI